MSVRTGTTEQRITTIAESAKAAMDAAIAKRKKSRPTKRFLGSNGGKMKFSEVLEKLKDQDKCMAFRSGWNGKGMFLFLVPNWTYTNGWMDNFPNLPFIAMKTADDKVVPWLASQTDILAEDWNYTNPEGPRP